MTHSKHSLQTEGKFRTYACCGWLLQITGVIGEIGGGRFMTRLGFTYTVVVSYLDLVPKCSLMLSVEYFNLTRVNL